MNDQTAQTADRMRTVYLELFGKVPELVEQRLAVAGLAHRLDAIEIIEEMRKVLINSNPLGPGRQQLVHFGQLIVLGDRDAATRHAVACRKNGATPSELLGVVETALITAGIPAYNLGVDILYRLFVGQARMSGPTGE